MSIEIPNNKGNNRKRGKRGETTREIIRLIIEKPGLSLYEIADTIGCTHENARIALEKLKQKPESTILFGYDQETVRLAISCRSTKTMVKKEAPWRGKANWPASKTATKKGMSNAELVKACGQHYTFKNGKYIINQNEIDQAVIKITENKSNKKMRIVKGRPAIPVSFTFN